MAKRRAVPAIHTTCVDASDLERLRRLEWLLTTGTSGFAMGSASGVPSRRYHGVLVSDTPGSPERRVYVNALEEELVITDAQGGTRVEPLSCFRFRAHDGSDVLHPEGWRALRSFEKGVVCQWTYEVDGTTVVKRLAVRRDVRAAVVEYVVTPPPGHTAAKGLKVELRVRPLVSLRSFHSLQHRGDDPRGFTVTAAPKGCEVRRADGAANLHISSDSATFQPDEQWWYNFVYSVERERGQDFLEDLFSPGEFSFRPGSRRTRIEGTLQFALDAAPIVTIDEIADSMRELLASRIAAAGAEKDGVAARLACAAEDYVFTRRPSAGAAATASYESVIAGYPWFADWGRDSMISLPGLFLVTGRHDEALRVLERFARARRNGIVPNRFGDELGEPLYNTVDASLWFIIACAEYGRAVKRPAPAELVTACLDIVDHYGRGTEWNIGMDPHDFLIAAGSPLTQLTWMDAQRDGVVFTPRHGKAVEINALWYAALRELADLVSAKDAVKAADLRAMADAAGASFRSRFWNEARGCCYDTLTPDGDSWRGVDEVRPNQVFAASLPHSPLAPAQARSVVRVVREELVTPLGVRTLAPGHPGYRGRFRGPIAELDAAYHNGTAWPWLMGAVAEAVMRVDGFSEASRREARALLTPLTQYLDSWCIGQLPEVFDGDGTPSDGQRPGGCAAQAWSVAEVLRVWVMAGRS